MRFLPLALVLTLTLAGCNQQQQGAAPGGKMPPPEVGFVVATPQTVNVTAALAGRVVPSLIAEVRPQVSGIIEKRLFEEGSEVKEGDVLYQIADASYRASKASAQASLDRAKAALVAAQAKSDRYEKLANRDVASAQETEAAVAGARQAQADVAAAQAALDAANINLGYTKVRAPITGRIGLSSLTEGALVTASQSNVLATIQALNKVFVDTPQSSSEVLAARAEVEAGLLKARPDGAAYQLILDSGQPYSLEGVLRFADVTVNAGTGTVTLRAVFDNPDRILLPNMFVRGVATLGQRVGAILAPMRAVTRDPRGDAFAYVIGAGDKIEARRIEISRSVDQNWIVDKGLNAGDRMVVDGFQRIIAPGAVVKPVPFTEAANGAAAGAASPAKPAEAGKPAEPAKPAEAAKPADAANSATAPKK